MLFHLPFSTGIFYLMSTLITIAAVAYAVVRALKRGDIGLKKRT